MVFATYYKFMVLVDILLFAHRLGRFFVSTLSFCIYLLFLSKVHWKTHWQRWPLCRMISKIKKYEFWILIIFAIAMYLSENIFGIDGLHDIGTVFFLIAIISLSIKKFMNKNNWIVSANHCLKLLHRDGFILYVTIYE